MMNWLMAGSVWVLIVYVTVNFGNFAPGPASGAPLVDVTPNPVTRSLKLILIAIGALVIGARWAQARRLARHLNTFFIAMVLLALCSVAWSIDSGATIARSVGLSAAVLVSFAFCLVAWHRTRFQDVVRPLLTLLLAGSLIAGLVEPHIAIDPDGWRGLASQKNPFGELAGFSALLWMHGLISGEIKWWRAAAGAGLSGVCLVLSKSSTSILATTLGVVFLLLLLRMPSIKGRYSRYIVIAFAVTIVAYALAVLKLIPGLDTVLLGPVTAITGKDMTFSNRSSIWQIVKDHAELSPILGTGYGAFWTDPVPGSPSYIMVVRLYFWPSESHNGYLEIFNDLGVVGLICLVGYLIVFVRQSLRLFRSDRSLGALYLALFFQQAMTNLSESCWFSANGVLAVSMMCLATCSLARSLLDQQRAHSSQASAAPMFNVRRPAATRF
jgi:O-antigen ligase